MLFQALKTTNNRGSMEEQIKLLIEQGEFAEAKKLVLQTEENAMDGMFFNMGNDDENINLYTFFVASLLEEQESVKNHVDAATWLTWGLHFIEGAYETAFYHVQRALELDPENTKLMSMLLFICHSPTKERLLTKDETASLALKILEKDPSSYEAFDHIYGFEESQKRRNEKTIRY